MQRTGRLDQLSRIPFQPVASGRHGDPVSQPDGGRINRYPGLHQAGVHQPELVAERRISPVTKQGGCSDCAAEKNCGRRWESMLPWRGSFGRHGSLGRYASGVFFFHSPAAYPEEECSLVVMFNIRANLMPLSSIFTDSRNNL